MTRNVGPAEVVHVLTRARSTTMTVSSAAHVARGAKHLPCRSARQIHRLGTATERKRPGRRARNCVPSTSRGDPAIHRECVIHALGQLLPASNCRPRLATSRESTSSSPSWSVGHRSHPHPPGSADRGAADFSSHAGSVRCRLRPCHGQETRCLNSLPSEPALRRRPRPDKPASPTTRRPMVPGSGTETAPLVKRLLTR